MREPGQLGGEALCFRSGLTQGDEAVRQPKGERLICLNSASCQDHVEGAALPDETRQSDRAAVDKRNAPAPTKHAKHRTRGRDPQVAPQREFETASHGIPLHRSDDRLAQQHPGRPNQTITFRFVGDFAACQRLEVEARTEVTAFACENGDRARFIGLERGEGRPELVGGLRIDRVAHFWAIDDDRGDRTILLDMDFAHVSGSSNYDGDATLVRSA